MGRKAAVGKIQAIDMNKKKKIGCRCVEKQGHVRGKINENKNKSILFLTCRIGHSLAVEN